MKAPRIRCKYCGALAEITNWQPGRGLDPNMRQFLCPLCKRLTYARVDPDTGFPGRRK